MVIGIPGQALADGIMVYLTTAGVFVRLNKVWEIRMPLPLEYPVGVPL